MTIRIDPIIRQQAVTVLAAALAEVGYPGSTDARLPTASVPPSIAYKAYTLALQSVGREPVPYDEWPAALLAFHANSPDELRYWRSYFNRHGITP